MNARLHGSSRPITTVAGLLFILNLGVFPGCFPGALCAQTAEAERVSGSDHIADTIIVTADALNSESAAPLPGVTILTVADLERDGYRTVADALSGRAGISIQRAGSAFESSVVRLRGSTGDQVLVLRDGRMVGSGRNMTVDMSRLPLSGLERIEIIQGPATALFGIGGAAGAINLISAPGPATPVPDRWEGTLSQGTLGETRAGIRFERARTGVRESIQTERAVTMNLSGGFARNGYRYDRAGVSEVRENAGGYDFGVDAAVTTARPRLEIRFGGWASVSRRGLAGTIEFPSDSARIDEQTLAVSLGLSGNRVPDGVPDRDVPDRDGGRFSGSPLSATIDAARQTRRFEDAGYPLGALSDESTLYRIDAAPVWNAERGSVHGTFPLSLRAEILEDSALGSRRRFVSAAAPGVKVCLGTNGGFDFTGRIEAVDAAPDFLPSARSSIWWQPFGSDGTIPVRFSVTVASGYRLPSYSELFWPVGAFAVGNADLVPEQNDSIEIETRLLDGISWSGRIAAYANRYVNLIQWLPDPNGYWSPRNNGDAFVFGVDTEIGYDRILGLSPWSFEAEVRGSILQARDRNAGPTYDMQLPYRPQVTAGWSTAIRHLLNRGVRIDLQATGARPATAQNTVWLDAYLVVDGSAYFEIPGTEATITATIHNAADASYTDTRFYPVSGRELEIGVEAAW